MCGGNGPGKAWSGILVQVIFLIGNQEGSTTPALTHAISRCTFSIIRDTLLFHIATFTAGMLHGRWRIRKENELSARAEKPCKEKHSHHQLGSSRPRRSLKHRRYGKVSSQGLSSLPHRLLLPEERLFPLRVTVVVSSVVMPSMVVTPAVGRTTTFNGTIVKLPSTLKVRIFIRSRSPSAPIHRVPRVWSFCLLNERRLEFDLRMGRGWLPPLEPFSPIRLELLRFGSVSSSLKTLEGIVPISLIRRLSATLPE